MASILRFTWHGRRFSEFFSMGRFLTSNKYNATNRKIILQHVLNKSNQIRSLATQNDSIGMENHKVANALNKLVVDARKESRISLEDVDELFNHLEESDRMTPDGRRAELMHVIWTALEEDGVVFDVRRYNLLLKIYLKNEYNFNPTDFLAQMEAKNVAPNRITYQRLISRYCQLGDIEGAERILDFMKKKKFTINKHVYNSLIMGHARSNNIEAAKGVFDFMRNSGMDLSASSYVPLLCAYAEKGDIDNIRQIIEEEGLARNNYIFGEKRLVRKHYVEIIYNLAKNGHLQHVEKIRKLFRKFHNYNVGGKSVISKLVNRGQEEVAMRLLGHLPTLVNYTQLTRNFFIDQLVEHDRPIEKIVEMCKYMKTSGMNTQAFHKATETALESGKIDLALKLMKALKEEDLPIRTRYFWPILTNSKKRDESELYDIFDSMIVCGCPAYYDMFLYFYSLINTDDYKVVITKLRDFGYKLDAIVSPLVQFYVTEKKLEKACSLLNEYPIQTNVNFLIRAMAVTCKQTNNVKTTVELLKLIKEKTDRDTIDRTDIVGQFLLTYSRIERSVEKTDILAKEILQNRLQISPEMSDLVRSFLQLDEQDSLTSTLQTLTSSTIQFSTDDVELENQSEESSEGLKANGRAIKISVIAGRIVETTSTSCPNKSSLGDMTQQKAEGDRWIKEQAQDILRKYECKISRQTQGRKFWIRYFRRNFRAKEGIARYGYPKEELNEIIFASKLFSYLSDEIQNQRRTVPKTIRHGKIKSVIVELENEDAEWEALKVEFEAELDALNDRWAIELVEDLKAAIAELKTEDVELEAEDAELKAEYAELKAEKVNFESEETVRGLYSDGDVCDDEYCSDWEGEWEDNPFEDTDDLIKAEFEFQWKDKNYDYTTKLLADILYVSKKIKRKTKLREFWINHLNRNKYFRGGLFNILSENGYPYEELNTISIATNISKVFSFLIRIMRNQ